MPPEPISNRRLAGVTAPTQPTRITSKQAGENVESGFWSSITNAVDSIGSVAANSFENARRIAWATKNFDNPNVYQDPDGVVPNDHEILARGRGEAGGFLDGELINGVPNTILLIGGGLVIAAVALR